MVATAEGKKDALFTLLGALSGAFIFSLLFPTIEALLIENANFGALTLEHLIGVQGIYLAIPLSAVLLFVAFFGLKDRYQ